MRRRAIIGSTPADGGHAPDEVPNPMRLAVVTMLFVVAVAACSSPAVIVWVGGDEGGARLTTCPVVDCEPIVALARASLDRAHPGHAPIVLERLGTPACGPTENTLCTYGGPLGVSSRWAVVFDLDDGLTSVRSVLCFEPEFADGATIAWNGQGCFAL
jgi:hypothetical protein